MWCKEVFIMKDNQKTTRKIIATSETDKALSKKIKEVSDRIMTRNYKLYKELENK